MKTAFSTAIICFSIASVAIAQEDEIAELNGHTARIVHADKSIDIPCNRSLVDFLFATAREAGNHADWALEGDVLPTSFITFQSETSWKSHLGSRGFTGLRSITVEVESPYRVIVKNAGDVFVSTLPEESKLLLANQVLWQTTTSLQR